MYIYIYICMYVYSILCSLRGSKLLRVTWNKYAGFLSHRGDPLVRTHGFREAVTWL